jgi:hypothetical protein
MDKARLKQGIRVHRPDLPGDPHGTITSERDAGGRSAELFSKRWSSGLIRVWAALGR